MQFAAQNQERLAVDDELRGGAAFLEMWRRTLLRGQVRTSEAGEKQKNRQRATGDSHIDRENSMRRRTGIVMGYEVSNPAFVLSHP